MHAYEIIILMILKVRTTQLSKTRLPAEHQHVTFHNGGGRPGCPGDCCQGKCKEDEAIKKSKVNEVQRKILSYTTDWGLYQNTMGYATDHCLSSLAVVSLQESDPNLKKFAGSWIANYTIRNYTDFGIHLYSQEAWGNPGMTRGNNLGYMCTIMVLEYKFMVAILPVSSTLRSGNWLHQHFLYVIYHFGSGRHSRLWPSAGRVILSD